MNTEDFQKDFFNQIHPSQQLRELFEYIPDIYFFMKDKQCRFVSVNRTYIEMCNRSVESDFIGKTDFDFFPKERAEKYINDDLHVIRSGKSMVNIVELAPEYNQATNWVIVSKIPVLSIDNKIIGTAGIGRNYNKARSTLQPYAEMAEAIRYVDEHYFEEITIEKLAHLVNLSISQFERKFKKTFQIAPRDHIIQVRLKVSCHLLSTSNESISTIALKCGFYDHSHFTRYFKESFGVSPREFKKRFL
jgi:AraC-like DNA-binding protein